MTSRWLGGRERVTSVRHRRRGEGIGSGRQRILIALVVLCTALVSVVAPVAADEPPTVASAPQSTPEWSACTTPEEDFCFEYMEYVDANGSVTDLVDRTTMPTVAWSISSGAPYWTGPPENRLIGPHFFIRIGGGSMGGGVIGAIPDGVYRTTLRLGRWSPQLGLIMAHVEDYAVTGDSASGWKVSLALRPAPRAMGNYDECVASQWTCRAEVMTESGIEVIFPPEGEMPGIWRGGYIEANTQVFNAPLSRWQPFALKFTAFAPHLLPTSFGNGHEVAPAFYEAFIPRAALESSFPGIALDTVTLTSFIQESSLDLGALTIRKSSDGILFKFGITHWSQPDPVLRFRPWPTIDLEATNAQFAAHMGPGSGMSQLPTGDVVFAACRDVACTSIDESTSVRESLSPNASTATARVSRSSLPAGAPNYRAYYVGDGNYPEGARAFSGDVQSIPNFAG